MLVKNWMSQPVITIDADDSMNSAVKLLRKHRIRMLPVLENGKLKGIVTDRDLKRASASDATSLEIHELIYLLAKIKIKNVMTHEAVTVPDHYTIEETAEVLLKHKISGAPVVDRKNALTGVITQTDILRVILSLTGIRKQGVLFAFQLEDRPGFIKELTDRIREFGGRIISILSTDDKVPPGFRNIYIRAGGLSAPQLSKLSEWFKDEKNLMVMIHEIDGRRVIYENPLKA